MKTLTKEEILEKWEAESGDRIMDRFDYYERVVFPSMQDFSDQETARLTAISEKQAELIKIYKEQSAYLGKYSSGQLESELQSLKSGEEKEEDKCTCQIADKGSHSNFCKRCNKHTY